ncbi:hypothetical protein [Celerinatantimonas sp. YJH-8]|uniref:hypothetical protein n=1 Tax=Celerinatantimonas sp. YJH-8 TaxID=3228714 RepID=UPI0038C87E1A
MKLKPSELLNQWSTWRGIALTLASALGAPAALVAAGGHLLSAIPAVATAAIGLYDTFRDENKEGKAAAKEQGADTPKIGAKK